MRGLWTPDGSALVYGKAVLGALPNVVRRPLDGSGEVEVLTDKEHITVPLSWAADGKRLLIEEIRPDTQRDIGVLDIDTLETTLILSSPSNERPGSLSPDGAWIFYASDESGRKKSTCKRIQVRAARSKSLPTEARSPFGRATVASSSIVTETR